MVVYRVCQFSVIVKDEPASLPPLGSVDGVREVPVRSYEEVATFRDLPAGFVQLDSRGRVVLFQSEAVGALALVKDIRGELPAFNVGHVCLFILGTYQVPCYMFHWTQE